MTIPRRSSISVSRPATAIESSSGKWPNRPVSASNAAARAGARPRTSCSTWRKIRSVSACSLADVMIGWSPSSAPHLASAAARNKLAREGFGQRRPVARVPGTQARQAPARADLLHPVALVRIVAGAEVDPGDPVAIDDLLEQGGAQRGSCRERLGAFEVSELVDPGSAVFDGPELRGD